MEIRELTREKWQEEPWATGLAEIPQPPGTLWLRGAMPSEGHKKLVVVGSRAMSRYGQEACQVLIAGLAGYPISIISGLALGMDTAAHKAALAAGLHTLALPGSGLGDEVIYPASNRAFAAEILNAGGGMLAEYPPSAKTHLHYFPARNRLMVGLADAVLIVEAGPKSGTLITARLAGEYNRDLLAVPHRIGDPHAFGPHLFVRLGAALVTEPLHILEALGIPPRDVGLTMSNIAEMNLGEAELAIWNLLEEPHERDDILREVGGNAGETLTALVALELRGLVKEEFGAWRRV